MKTASGCFPEGEEPCINSMLLVWFNAVFMRIKSMSYRITAPASRVLLAVLLTAITVVAQIEFNRPKAAKPLPNPSIINATRDDVLSVTKQMLETR